MVSCNQGDVEKGVNPLLEVPLYVHAQLTIFFPRSPNLLFFETKRLDVPCLRPQGS